MSPLHDLHVFFLPFLAPGHMIPMVDLARIVASRGVKVTIVTTTANLPLIQPSIDRSSHSIQLLTLNVSSSSAQNLTTLPSPDLTPEFIEFIDSFQEPFQELLNQHHPDFLVTDAFYPWTADLGIPRLVFHGSSSFGMVVAGSVSRHKIHESMVDDTEPFVVPGLPHRIELTKSQLMGGLTKPSELFIRMGQSFGKSYGMVSNSFYELETEYISRIRSSFVKSWNVGPVSLCNQEADDKAVRGGRGVSKGSPENCLSWLESKKPGSVLYVCFGSLGRFTCAQMREIALGLEDADCSFIWVIRDCADMTEWMPEGFEDRNKFLIVPGWAPQILILNHEAVGGFMTHCGWNSCLEGVSAGVPMITWPLFAEQFFNEKLLVDVVRIGVSVGAKVCTFDPEKRTFVKSEEVRNAVNELMGIGEEPTKRRKRAEEMRELAKKAVEEGGSSYNEMSTIIEEMMKVKAGKKTES